MSLTNSLSKTGSLWASLVLVVLITAAFPVAASVWNLSFLNTMSDPDQVREAIAAMSTDQRIAHSWITGTLDVLYPLAYGALFIGSAYAFYGSYGWLVALPFFVLVPTDFLEGVVQILALNDVSDWVESKAVLTPLKTGLFLLGIVTTVIGWIVWLVNRLKRENAA